MGIFHRIRKMIGKSTQDGDEHLHNLLAGFDDYCQKCLIIVDKEWDASKRMRSIEYCLFLYGAALAISRGSGRGDGYSAVLWSPYISRFMELSFALRWTLACEEKMCNSKRLQGVRAAGANTAHAVFFAGSRGRSDILNSYWNKNLIIQIFGNLRKLIDDENKSDEPIFAASGELYDSVVGELDQKRDKRG